MSQRNLGSTGDWLKLQRKIFTRWVNQKVAPRGIKVDDVVNDINDGHLLVNLLEALSEKKCTAKIEKGTKVRVKQIDSLNNALNFTWSCGVQLKIKPSAENFADGDERAVLGLIWAVMLKYMKIGDEEGAETLNAKDALLLWCQNKTLGYKDVKVDNFTSSFHDGLALAAIIHKHRPKLIDFASLNKEHKKENLALVMDAAEKYFNLEKYLTPDEVLKLDENSMVVYVSEYYYGIAEQRKLDLAARRLAKLIKTTKENDALRAEYKSKSEGLLAHLKKVEHVLEDRTIDNTMAGAKRRIEEFYDYKTKDKNVIIGDQLSLEAVYNTLSMKLAHHKRPEFHPPEGLTLKDIEKAITHLEACEQERKVALHAELNRQIKLVKLDQEHSSRHNKLSTWSAEKDAYLSKKEEISSVSQAQLQLKLLDAYEKEAAGVKGTSVAHVKKLGEELVREHYEKHHEVTAREQEIDAAFVKLDALSQAKRPVLDDDLAREQFKDKVRLANKQHVDKYAQLAAWIAEKEAYLNKKEHINSVSEAQTQLTLLEGYGKAYTNMTNTNVTPFEKLGEHILAQKYETQYSSWSLETAGDVKQRNETVAEKWALLAKLHSHKLAILNDDLARETFKDKVRLMNQEHTDLYNQLKAWIAEKEAYLNVKETVNSVGDAQKHLTVLEGYRKAFANMSNNVPPFTALGEQIVAEKYETEYSSWSLETADEVRQRNEFVKQKWEELQKLASAKHDILSDDLAREKFKEKVRLMDQEHQDVFNQLSSWIAEKEAYLSKKEEINSVSDATTQLTLLAAFNTEKDSTEGSSVKLLKERGEEILAQHYKTEFSSWSIEDPEQIKTRESTVHHKWELLTQLSASKHEVLTEDLKRETEKERLRLEFAHLATSYTRWARETAQEVEASQFGFNLEDVEAYAATLAANNSEIQGEDNSKHTEYNHVHAKLVEYGVTENPYTTITLEHLGEAKTGLHNTISARNHAYETELARQRANDALCKEFAGHAEPFCKAIVDFKDGITHSKDALEQQLGFVEGKLSSVHTDAGKLPEIKSLYQKIEAAGITNNRYTTLTQKDVEVQWEQYEAFLHKKKAMLEEEIEHHKLRGITAEQLKEIDENFKQFDTNGDGILDKRELKACLYSLGEEKTNTEVEKIMTEFGSADKTHMPKEGFKNFMVKLYGDTDTKDEILDSFKLINKGGETATHAAIEMVMATADVEYFESTAPRGAAGDFDYKHWTETIFSR